MNKPAHCEDPRCQYLKRPAKYTHSTELYYPELYINTGRMSYWACNECVDYDHELFEEKHNLKSPQNGYRKVKGRIKEL